VASLTPLRRMPVQQRSAKRVEQMLSACAELIEEVGYDGVTTTLIAERAGVAVGSLYQFFPDKRAVVRELTRRNFERFMSAVTERLADGDLVHWWDVVDSLFDVYLAMHREVPGFSRVHFGDVVDVRLLDEERDNNTVLADELTKVVADRTSSSPEEISLPIAIAVEAADSVLRMAFRHDPHGDQRIVDEVKLLVRSYLAIRLGDKTD
jgi:AcrR family transcriptional regulator